MTGAMYAAIAGLKTHMQNLNIIGNNIANVNTYGYKASRAVFKTSLYTTLSGGSNGTTVMGGTNPSQIGYGSTVSSVDVDMSTGNYAVTGKSTDLMLDGDGFFLVGSKEIALNFDGTTDDINRLTAFTLTRVGNFEFRADGYLAKEDGNCVYGFLCTGLATQADVEANKAKKVGDPIFSDQLVPIRFPRVETAYYAATGERLDPSADPTAANNNSPFEADGVTLKAGVTQGLAIAYPTTYTYGTDNNGNQTILCTDGQYHLVTEVNAADSTFVPQESHLQDAGYDPALEDSILPKGKFTGISFDPNTGIITATSADTEEVVTIGCIAVGTVTNPNGVTNLGDNYYKAGEGSGELSVSVIGGNAKNMYINQVNRSLQNKDRMDPNNQQAYDAEYAAKAGDIYGLNIYSSASHIVSNGLEMSKTDLAQEIAQMILTQRGYQANTRIITVTDAMLEELVNIKR